jgi:phosphate:Na+ symporter
MLRKILSPIILIVLGYGFWISPNFKEISAGVAIFLFGMLSLEEGFRAFSGGALEKILTASTNKLWKSIGFGFVSTAIMQSSSLVSVLTISFIGAGLIGLTQGIGIILGANIGTTTGAWLMAGFGLKVKISAYAMPMLVFGVILIFQKAKSLKGIGYILAGLGFLFLGIHFMKEGFESFKESIDLASFAVGGLEGLLIYIGIGIFATVVMQSSHATIVLILTALSVGQITYENAVALTIGANIGTTITAIIGSLSSNIDGKRLAGGHLIFNVVTATITVLIFHQVLDVVQWIADSIGIAPDNHTLRLAVFDSLFKIMGVVIFIPFVDTLVRFLERTLKKKETHREDMVEKAEFLNDSVLEFPITAFKATLDESKRLLDNAMIIIADTLGVPADKLFSDLKMDAVFAEGCCTSTIDIDAAYKRKLKGIYGEIVTFVIQAQMNVGKEYINSYHNIKLANRNTIEAVKMTEQLRHNLDIYLHSDNTHIKREYIKMIKRIAKLLHRIRLISQTEEKQKAMELSGKAKKILAKNDIVANGRLDKLIRGNHIDHDMASSLMNDSAYTNNIIRSLIISAGVLWIDPSVDIRTYREEIFLDKEKAKA